MNEIKGDCEGCKFKEECRFMYNKRCKFYIGKDEEVC